MANSFNLLDEVTNLGFMSGLPEQEIDQFQRENGPLYLGLDSDDEPVERDGGGVGNILIVGWSRERVRLERAILRGIQLIRPKWTPPHSIANLSPQEWEAHLEAQIDPEATEEAALSGMSAKSTLKAIRYFGPQALVQEVNLAYDTMLENMAFMEKFDLNEPPADSVHTLFIHGLDKLLPQHDDEAIYETLGKLANVGNGNVSSDYGVNLIISAEDHSVLTKKLKDNMILLALSQDTQTSSITTTGYRGMEQAAPFVAAIETRSGARRTFRF